MTSDVNVEVCRRQLIGKPYIRKASTSELAKALKDGSLQLPPHPTWKLPDSLTWEEDPFEQRNWRFQLHTLRWLAPLRLEAAMGDSEAEKLWLHYVSSWLEKNLFSEDDYAWMDMADGTRTIELVLGYPLVPNEDKDTFTEAIRIHATHLADLKNRGHGNHALHQLQGLFVAACFLRDENLKDVALTQINELFSISYDEEGVSNEASLRYHDLNYAWWLELIKRLKVEDVDVSHMLPILNKGREMLIHGVRPDGFLEMLGDTNYGSGISSDGSPETEYVRSAGLRGTPPSDRAVSFSAGYAFGRSGWGEYERDFSDETFYSLRFGHDNAIHGHPDSTSITLAANGVQWIVDPGMYAYKKSRHRNYVKSREAHNVVISTTKAFNRDESQPELLDSERSDTLDSYLIVLKPYKGFKALRRFIYDRAEDIFIVVDEIVRTDDKESFGRFTQLWHIGPDTTVTQYSNGAVDLQNGSKTAHIRWSDRVRPELNHGDEGDIPAWYTSGYNKAEPSTVISAIPTTRGLLRWTTVFSFGEKTWTPQSLEQTTKTGHFSLTIQSKEETRKYNILLDANTASSQSVKSNKQEINQVLEKYGFHSLETSPSEYSAQELYRESMLKLQETSYREETLHENIKTVAGWLSHSQNTSLPDGALTAHLFDLISLKENCLVHPSSFGFSKARHPFPLKPEIPLDSSSTGTTYQLLNQDETTADFTPAKQTVFIRRTEDCTLPMSFIPGKSDTLIVLFHGALRRESVNLPYLRGRGVAHLVQSPLLSVGDSTLDLDPSLTLGWYLGTKKADLTKLVCEEAERLCDRLGCKRVLFVGSSGGGFAAIATALHSRRPDVHALAFNPQTDITRYYPGAANAAIKAVFGHPLTEVNAVESERCSLIKRALKAEGKPTLHIVQNVGDVFHLKNHFDPFVKELEGSTIPQRLTFVDSGPGHKSADASLMASAISLILKAERA